MCAMPRGCFLVCMLLESSQRFMLLLFWRSVCTREQQHITTRHQSTPHSLASRVSGFASLVCYLDWILNPHEGLCAETHTHCLTCAHALLFCCADW